jgi:hypothetical protein
MSLDTEKLHRLTGKGFDKLSASDPAKYKEMAHKALEYSKTCVPTGEKVRIGDVVSVIQNAVRILPSFEAHIKAKKLTQKYWQLWFAEYILEQVFPQPDLK